MLHRLRSPQLQCLLVLELDLVLEMGMEQELVLAWVAELILHLLQPTLRRLWRALTYLLKFDRQGFF